MSLDDLDPAGLYHLASTDQWAEYQGAGHITPESLETEGFVHCSWGRQVPGTVAKHFDGVTGLHALELDAGALGDIELREEDLYDSGQTYPHAYGPVPTDAVVGVVPLD